jgi:hypothetical protein
MRILLARESIHQDQRRRALKTHNVLAQGKAARLCGTTQPWEKVSHIISALKGRNKVFREPILSRTFSALNALGS